MRRKGGNPLLFLSPSLPHPSPFPFYNSNLLFTSPAQQRRWRRRHCSRGCAEAEESAQLGSPAPHWAEHAAGGERRFPPPLSLYPSRQVLWQQQRPSNPHGGGWGQVPLFISHEKVCPLPLSIYLPRSPLSLSLSLFLLPPFPILFLLFTLFILFFNCCLVYPFLDRQEVSRCRVPN